MDEPSFDPASGVVETLAPGLRRILAPNPSPMTYRGTNTYLLGSGEVAVIDPGPDDETHLSAIGAALGPGQRVSHILVTHAHRDHSALAPRLSRRTGAPVCAYGHAADGRSAAMQMLARAGGIDGGEGVDEAFDPDVTLADGESVRGAGWQLIALWTPGHMGNHLCFAWQDTVFSGDLAMGWSSSLISPPDGDVADFLASCRRLAARAPRRLWPGHGAPVDAPSERLDWLVRHRLDRERQIRAALAGQPGTARAIAERVYAGLPRDLLVAATRNVLAHLVDLSARGEVDAAPRLASDAVFSLRAT